MNELQAATAALTGLKTAFDLSKAFLDVKGAVEVQGKVFELQRVILAAQQDASTAQQAQAALLKRIDELEKKIADLEAWDGEKERYELAAHGNGVLAYRLKPQTQGAEPEHSLCPNCYQNHRKSILQPEMQHPGRVELLVCHACGLDIILHGQREAQPAKRAKTSKPPSNPWGRGY